MDRLLIIGKWLYAVSFVVFGIQHIIYAAFVATLVPGWIPWHMFWVYFVAFAFMAAGISILINKYVWAAGVMAGSMLAIFILLIHVPNLLTHPDNPQSWTRALQDVSIMGTALMLTGDFKLQNYGRCLFAVPMIVLGLQHFAHFNFVTAKVPDYFPGVSVWDYLVGATLIVLAIGTLTNRYLGVPATMLGIVLLLFALLYHLPLLISNLYNGQQWTGAMLDSAITGGAFIASAIPAVAHKSIKMATQG